MATKTIQDYTREEIDKFWNSLDIESVNKYFSKVIGITVEMKKARQDGNYGKVYYSLEDETNIAPKSPITNAAWRNMTVDSRGGWMNVSESTGNLTYCALIHISYESYDGGHNGTEIGKARFAEGEWTFTAEKERSVR